MFRANFCAPQERRATFRSIRVLRPLEEGMASFCAGCGSSVSAGDKFCRACGRTVSPDSAVIPASGAPQAGLAETSGKAIASLIFGLLFLFTPFAIVAVILSHLSMSEIRKMPGGGRETAWL